jgi:hypothetical protein
VLTELTRTTVPCPARLHTTPQLADPRPLRLQKEKSKQKVYRVNVHGFCHVTCMFLVTKKAHIDLQFPLSESHKGVLVSESVQSTLEGLLSRIARRESQSVIAAKGGFIQCFNVITRDHTSALSLPWFSSCATTTTSCGSALGASIGSQCGRNTAFGQSLAAIRGHL